ncbi:ABC transporter permease [Actinomadura craniellae]|uniref:ABC transporter permease n=1 Tax=Actinomadura craniellae TaxID=2231787 RepID=A0A365HDH8_9ACTN|nr:ABC transporter permease [Actinomadura craniellae]RAY17099.1 ABC transporter permease [Actinomadura craniellae]
MTLLDTELAPGAEPARKVPLRGRQTWRRLRADRPAMAGLAIVASMIVVALAAPLLCALEGQDPTTFHSGLLDSARGGVPHGAFGGMSGDHWLGVEPGTGRDVFARVVHGARVSLAVALGATVLELLVGIAIGLGAGLGGRRADAVLSRLIELSLAFPPFLLALALMAIVPQSVPRPLLLACVLTAVNWGSVARVTRNQAMALRGRDHVAAARLSGARPARIAVREILPGLAAPLLVLAALKVPANMISEAGLSFLGAGVRPPTPSWGQMLSTATTWFRTDPAYVIIPGALLFTTLLACTLLADGVRRAVDPRWNGRS